MLTFDHQLLQIVAPGSAAIEDVAENTPDSELFAALLHAFDIPATPEHPVVVPAILAAHAMPVAAELGSEGGNALPAIGNVRPPEALLGVIESARTLIGTIAEAPRVQNDAKLLRVLNADGEQLASTKRELADLPTAGAAPLARTPTVVTVPAVPSLAPAAVLDVNAGQTDTVLARQLQWMVQQGRQQAWIRVQPEQLGTIEIKLKVNGDSAQVTFTSQSAYVRELLEQSVPRLREALADAGLHLGDVDVAAGGRDTQDGGAFSSSSHDSADGDSEPPVESSLTTAVGRNGLLDTYA